MGFQGNKGADLSLKDRNGHTCAQSQLNSRNFDAYNYLISRGAPGQSPLKNRLNLYFAVGLNSSYIKEKADKQFVANFAFYTAIDYRIRLFRFNNIKLTVQLAPEIGYHYYGNSNDKETINSNHFLLSGIGFRATDIDVSEEEKIAFGLSSSFLLGTHSFSNETDFGIKSSFRFWLLRSVSLEASHVWNKTDNAQYHSMQAMVIFYPIISVMIIGGGLAGAYQG